MTDELAIWPGTPPGSEEWAHVEETFVWAGEVRVRNVVTPTLTPFLPDSDLARGTAVIVAPGGALHMLSWQTEGVAVAEWLRDRGIAAFVLKYRLVDTGPTQADFETAFQAAIARLFAVDERAGGPPRTMERMSSMSGGIAAMAAADGAQAVRFVRGRAAELGVRADRIGILGFSAGAFVAAVVAATATGAARPDFAAPVAGALGPTAPLPPDAPPLFLTVASDDRYMVPETVSTFEAWQSASRPVELHVYGRGGHVFAAAKQGLPVERWPERLLDWLGSEGLLGDG